MSMCSYWFRLIACIILLLTLPFLFLQLFYNGQLENNRSDTGTIVEKYYYQDDCMLSVEFSTCAFGHSKTIKKDIEVTDKVFDSLSVGDIIDVGYYNSRIVVYLDN